MWRPGRKVKPPRAFIDWAADVDCVGPWEVRPFKLWSLSELMSYAGAIFWAALNLSDITHSDHPDDAVVSEADRFDAGFRSINALVEHCKRLGLRTSLATVYKTMDALKSDRLTWGQLRGFALDVSKQLQIELNATTFVYMAPPGASLLRRPLAGWDAVLAKYPSIQVEIEEASKCLAYDRATAAVFHLMRVLEAGLKAVAWRLKIPYAPSWESYVKQINARIGEKPKMKGVQWKRDERFFAEVAAHFQSVRVAWRNPTMHIERVYTVEESIDIYNASRALMTHLASRLPERPVRRRKGAKQ